MSRAEELRMERMRQAPAAPAPAPTRNRRTVARPQPQIGQAPAQPFNWAQEYGNRVTSTNENFLPRSVVGTEGGLYADDIVNSTRNISGGEGGIFDYLTVGLAPLALAGFGAARGAQAVNRSPDAARMLALAALRNPNIVSRQGIDTLGQMARSGDTRFRNIYEIDPAASGRFQQYQEQGILNPASLAQEASRRSMSELELLGIPLDAAAPARPTYGVVTPALPFLASSAPRGRGYNQGAVEQMRNILSPRNPYLDEFGEGQANVVFRPGDLDRVTATAGDVGAAAFGGARGAAEQLGTPGIRNIAQQSVLDYKGVPSLPPFLEAQMYGANLANARKVTVPTREAQRELQQAFRRAGINVPVRLDRAAARRAARERALQERIANREVALRSMEWDDL